MRNALAARAGRARSGARLWRVTLGAVGQATPHDRTCTRVRLSGESHEVENDGEREPGLRT